LTTFRWLGALAVALTVSAGLAWSTPATGLVIPPPPVAPRLGTTGGPGAQVDVPIGRPIVVPPNDGARLSASGFTKTELVRLIGYALFLVGLALNVTVHRSRRRARSAVRVLERDLAACRPRPASAETRLDLTGARRSPGTPGHPTRGMPRVDPARTGSL